VKRREFITLLLGAATAWPLAVQAQQSDKMRRIGLLTSLNESDARCELSGGCPFGPDRER